MAVSRFCDLLDVTGSCSRATLFLVCSAELLEDDIILSCVDESWFLGGVVVAKIGRWFNTPAVTRAGEGANANEDKVLLLLPATTAPVLLPRRRIDDDLLLPNTAALAPQRKDVATHSAWTASFITCMCVEREKVR